MSLLSRWRVLAVAIVAALSLSGCGYNTIQQRDEAVKSAWAEVLSQYQRRADLIPNIVATVKGEADFEKTTLQNVIEARAKALSTNQDAVIAQQYAENYPAIVAAAASSLSNIDNLVVLNGAEGMEDMLAKAMTMGGAGLGLAQQLMTSIKGDKPAVVKLPAIPANGKVDHVAV